MPRKKTGTDKDGDLDAMIEEITVDAHGDDEQLWAFRQVIEDEVELPADGLILDQQVRVTKIDYDGNTRRGLTATCRREDGSRHVVAAADITFPRNSAAGRYVGAYKKWLGLPPYPVSGGAWVRKRQKISRDDLNLKDIVELVPLSVKQRAARCLLLGTERVVTFRSPRRWGLIPGEIATIQPRKQWTYGGNPYLSGDILETRLDISALGLTPLILEDRGPWNPEEQYWREEGEPLQEWEREIVAHGPRPAFEMQQVLPGWNSDDPFSDPIGQSNDLRDAGKYQDALKILMELCESDLRCLDAHAHLGNIAFEHSAKAAIRHYEVGVRMGELSLGDRFDGVLEWLCLDNRPYLRCLHGYGLCLWRLHRIREAREVFNRMLWLNPSDNQGARFLIHDIDVGRSWEASKED
jgi:tetratricopeptide (TPR) repeat protein